MFWINHDPTINDIFILLIHLQDNVLCNNLLNLVPAIHSNLQFFNQYPLKACNTVYTLLPHLSWSVISNNLLVLPIFSEWWLHRLVQFFKVKHMLTPYSHLCSTEPSQVSHYPSFVIFEFGA